MQYVVGREEIEYSPREMAIDCPDGFIPEVKTKPSLPNLISNQLKSKSNSLVDKKFKLSISSNESVKLGKFKKSSNKCKQSHDHSSPMNSSITHDETVNNLNLTSFNNTNLPLLIPDETFRSEMSHAGIVNNGFDITDDEKPISNIKTSNLLEFDSNETKISTSISYISNSEATQSTYIRSECSKIQSISESSVNFEHQQESKLESSCENLIDQLNINQCDFKKMLRTCNNDIELLNKILNSSEFLNKLNMCKKILDTNENIDLFNEV